MKSMRYSTREINEQRIVRVTEIPTEQEQVQWKTELVLQLVLLAMQPRMPIRWRFQMSTVSKSLNRACLEDSVTQPSSSQEQWLLMQALPGRRCFLGQEDWRLSQFVAFSDKETKMFSVPALNNKTNTLSSQSLRSLISRNQIREGKETRDDLCSYLLGHAGHRFPRSCSPSLSSAGGLISACVLIPSTRDIIPTATEQHWDYRIIVFNCITGAVKKLPVCPTLGYNASPASSYDSARKRNLAVHMAFNPAHQYTVHYYIMLCEPSILCPSDGLNSNGENFCSNGEYCKAGCKYGYQYLKGEYDWFNSTFHVYDSYNDIWKVPAPPVHSSCTSDWSQLIQCDFFQLRHSTCHNSRSIRNASHGITPYGTVSILGYRASTDQWFKTTMSAQNSNEVLPFFSKLAPELSSCAFTKYNGRLLLCYSRWSKSQPCTRDTQTVMNSYETKVLEVVPMSTQMSKLVEVSSMPKHLGRCVIPTTAEDTRCLCTDLRCTKTAAPFYRRRDARVVAGDSLFCVSFLPDAGYNFPDAGVSHLPDSKIVDDVQRFRMLGGGGANDDQHVVVYDLSSNRWFPVPLPNDDSNYTCLAVVRPQLTRV